MAWVNFPVVAGTAIQQGVVAELADAYRERRLARALSDPGTYGAPGDDIQDVNNYVTWQNWVESDFGQWVDNTASYHQAGAPANEAWVYTSLAAFRTAASLNASGFTRKYWRAHSNSGSTVYTDGSAFANGHKSIRMSDGLVYERVAGAWVLLGGCYGTVFPDTISTFGIIQAGDILGAWVFNELYQSFQRMSWRLLDTSFTAAETSHHSTATAGASNAAWATAKTNSEGTFDAGVLTTDTAELPEDVSAGSLNGGVYTGLLGAVRSRAFNNFAVPTFASRSMEFYAYTTKPTLNFWDGITGPPTTFTYDAHGFPIIENDYSRISTAGPSTSATLYSDYWGTCATGSYPNWCAQPTTQGGETHGFKTTRTATIIRWDVAGGFTKP